MSRLAVSLVVGLLYAAACICPAIEFAKAPPPPPPRDIGDIRIFGDLDPEAGTHIGLVALLVGWLPPWTMAWSANLCLLLGWILLLCRCNRVALGCGAAAALLGLSYPSGEDTLRGLVA
jgi:hypothetical protein